MEGHSVLDLKNLEAKEGEAMGREITGDIHGGEFQLRCTSKGLRVGDMNISSQSQRSKVWIEDRRTVFQIM